MSETTISERFEVVYRPPGYVSHRSPIDAGKWCHACWVMQFWANGELFSVALDCPTKRQAEIALAACERLGITPASYFEAGMSPAGSGELRRRIMEMFPW
jgi:hypothetical protein